MAQRTREPRDFKPIEMYAPVLQALIALGGKAYKDDVFRKVSEILPRTADFPNVEERTSNNVFRQRVTRANKHLSVMGYTRLLGKGIWQITELGRSQSTLSDEEAQVLFDNARMRIRSQRKTKNEVDDDEK